MALPFPNLRTAKACVDYVTQPDRADGKETLLANDLTIRLFAIGTTIAVVFFPQPKFPDVIPFWQISGIGISSRTAESALENMNNIQEVSLEDYVESIDTSGTSQDIKNRIAHLLNRGRDKERLQASDDDVYLFQTGMSAVYYVHSFLSKWQPNDKSRTVQLGVPFHQTTCVFAWWGAGFEFFPIPTELDALEEFLKAEQAASRPVKAIWAELPTNPLLTTPDFLRLRKLANQYRFVLIVDDTIGGFCNVDVLEIADIILTSLTKSFSGYADVMGGSAVLSKASPLYPELKAIFKNDYHNDLYPADALTLLNNSADYLERSAVLNSNAARLVEFLQSLTSDPKNSVTNVLYPTVAATRANYDAVKRADTADFTSGYGCLFSVDFGTLEETIAFYENLHFHQGPHLGAHRTLALAYVKLAYNDKMPEGEAWGMRDTQIRISVGLEDFDTLLATFKHALTFSDGVKLSQK
jgi:cystathionine gamma-synthase